MAGILRGTRPPLRSCSHGFRYAAMAAGPWAHAATHEIDSTTRLPASAAARQPRPRSIDDRVLHLFRNRAELKKAYSGLQDELQRLKDRIKQQEGATARVQEMLQGLEGAPERARERPIRRWSSISCASCGGSGARCLTQFVAELAAAAGRARAARISSPSTTAGCSIGGRASTPICALAEGRAAECARGGRRARTALLQPCVASGTTSSAARCGSSCRRPICSRCSACRISRAARAARDAARRRDAAGVCWPVDRGASRDQSGGHRLWADACAIACAPTEPGGAGARGRRSARAAAR